MKISPARKSAFEILIRIEKEKAFSSILLSLYEEKLEKKDRSLCREISLGVLRKKLYIDEIIKKFTKKPIGKFDLEVLIALRMGIYQILFLERIPDYSAINESVNIVKWAQKKSASGLVNAVLRKVLRKDVQIQFGDEVDRISIETSHPKWLIEKWVKRFGLEETANLAVANNKKNKLSFRFTRKFDKKTSEEKKRVLLGIEEISTQSSLAKNAITVNKPNETLRGLVEEGSIYFQGEGSQLVAEAVGLKRGESFLDACASPGSKTTQIARELDEESAIFAGDFHSHRMKILRNSCENQSVGFVQLVRYDGVRGFPFAKESFDVVLVDVPCSGTGTIRKNPEIRYHLTEKDFLSLHDKQLAILKNASQLVKKTGRVVYSTCSMEIEENEDVVEGFLKENRNFESVPPNLAKRHITADGFGVVRPHYDDSDGFFIAILRHCVS